MAVRVLDSEHCPGIDVLVADHVAQPDDRRGDGPFVRLNMIASADGGAAIEGRSGALGNENDRRVFGALRASSDAVLVGMATALAEHYHPPAKPGQQLYVVANRSDVSGNPELFASDQVTLVLPAAAGPVSDGVRELRAGTGVEVDLAVVVAELEGKVVMAEGGPRVAGQLVAMGLVDEFFITISPRVIAGDAARVVHGPSADPAMWNLAHGFVDDDGFLFLRYAKR